jgi:hypothetical protein
LESKSSTIEITNAVDLSGDSRRDKIRVRLADKIEATGSFSQFRISELKDKATFRVSYGSVDLEKIAGTFRNMYIESRSANVNLYFQPESKFNFEITETKTNLKLGREVKVENKETLDSKEGKNRHTGYLGKKMKDDQLIINSVGGEINMLAY